MLQRRNFGLDSLELKALSVPSSLRFLLGIEYDVVLCVTEVGTRRPFSLHFPRFAETFRRLLGLCANRFSLDCAHHDEGTVLSGSANMPLLRYVDYLPGALHAEEILACLQVTPATKARRRTPLSSSSSGEKESTNADAKSTNTLTCNEFVASFLDYTEFTSDQSLNDVHGLGFYLTLDYGLSMASHGHLVGIRFHSDWDQKEALREFQDFSGWDTFDVRFYDEQDKRQGGIIVLPSIQDACDLLEKYEDEDSDDEGDMLPFILRPVCPLVSVPSVEDLALRKLREQHWHEVERFWERFPKTKNTVVVFNLFAGATLKDVLTFFDGLPLTESVLVQDQSPAHRRRAFLTFATSEATRKALDLDGKSTRGRALRVQMSPPYISDSRRGTVVTQQPEPKDGQGTELPKPNTAKKTAAPTSVTTASEQEKTVPCAAPAKEECASQPPMSSLPSSKSEVTAAAETSHSPPCGASAPATTVVSSPSATPMSANAKEFVPSFVLSAKSPEFRPSQGLMPPPPSYQESVSPILTQTPVPVPPIFGHTDVYCMPPTYTLPPPYFGDVHGAPLGNMQPPPPYSELGNQPSSASLQ